jgi:H+/Cl- antiporter ClcA
VGESHVGLRPVPGIVVASLISLAVGASLGPEAPLLAVVGALAPWIALRIGRGSLGPLFSHAGLGSIFAVLFGSPMAAAFAGLETITIAGRALYTQLIRCSSPPRPASSVSAWPPTTR